MDSSDEFETSVSLVSLNFYFFLFFFLRDEFCHCSSRGAHSCFASYQRFDVACYTAPSFGSFLQTTSLQVRGISSSMFFLSFCGPCSLTAQFPRTCHVETSVMGGPDTTQLSLKKENLRKTLGLESATAISTWN